MAKKGGKAKKGPRQLERKANVSLIRAEGSVLERLKREHPEWVDEDGNCPSCVVEEHNLVEPHYYPGDD